MNIQDVLREMTDAKWRLSPSVQAWRETIKWVMSDPTAWMCEDEHGHRDTTLRRDTMDDWAYFGRKITPLYALPPDAAGEIERLREAVKAGAKMVRWIVDHKDRMHAVAWLDALETAEMMEAALKTPR